MDVTKIESQLLKLDKEHFNLNDILSNTVIDLQNEIEENKDSLYIMMLSLSGQAHERRMWAENCAFNGAKGASFHFSLPVVMCITQLNRKRENKKDRLKANVLMTINYRQY